MKCNTCNHYHTTTEPKVCTLLDCNCDPADFTPYIEKKSFEYYLDVMNSFDTVSQKVRYLLSEFKDFRNYTNKQFIFAYWHYNDNFCPGMRLDIKTYHNLHDPETIRRVRQKLVADNPTLAPFDEEFITKKTTKQVAIEEWVIQ